MQLPSKQMMEGSLNMHNSSNTFSDPPPNYFDTQISQNISPPPNYHQPSSVIDTPFTNEKMAEEGHQLPTDDSDRPRGPNLPLVRIMSLSNVSRTQPVPETLGELLLEITTISNAVVGYAPDLDKLHGRLTTLHHAMMTDAYLIQQSNWNLVTLEISKSIRELATARPECNVVADHLRSSIHELAITTISDQAFRPDTAGHVSRYKDLARAVGFVEKISYNLKLAISLYIPPIVTIAALKQNASDTEVWCNDHVLLWRLLLVLSVFALHEYLFIIVKSFTTRKLIPRQVTALAVIVATMFITNLSCGK